MRYLPGSAEGRRDTVFHYGVGHRRAVFCAALVSSVGRARTQHKEILICQWTTLPNTSDAMLIEPLMKCQDLQRWRTGGQCPGRPSSQSFSSRCISHFMRNYCCIKIKTLEIKKNGLEL